ncbi:phosphoribosylamine--glycine ligase [Frisingicoccus sp.]
MKVLIVGSGGREHAIAWKVAQSSRVEKIYCAPGNAGIEEYAECVNIGAMEFDKLTDFAVEKGIDLTIIGMDDPLVGGIVNAFEAKGLRVFGPRQKAAMIEGSKAFSKDLMKKYNIPTAGYENFDSAEEALKYLETANMPIVLKADGLALGKGVLICNTLEEARDGVKAIMEDKQFGTAGNRMVVEEFMTGREVSVLCFCDGTHVTPMTSAQDHKRAQDGDQGLNTGGMGTFSPSPFYTDEVDEFCRKYIYQATVDAMKAEGREFKGIIFFGLMLTQNGPKVLEYNARFGDPETQVVLPRMKNDIVDVFEACIDGTLDQVELDFEDNAAVCVVLASDGYPEHYEKGFKISGLDAFAGKDGYYVFHAGSKFDEDGDVVTNGGRVLGVTATGADLKQARANAYEAAKWIEFGNKYMRNDIGKAIDEADSQ